MNSKSQTLSIVMSMTYYYDKWTIYNVSVLEDMVDLSFKIIIGAVLLGNLSSCCNELEPNKQM